MKKQEVIKLSLLMKPADVFEALGHHKGHDFFTSWNTLGDADQKSIVLAADSFWHEIEVPMKAELLHDSRGATPEQKELFELGMNATLRKLKVKTVAHFIWLGSMSRFAKNSLEQAAHDQQQLRIDLRRFLGLDK